MRLRIMTTPTGNPSKLNSLSRYRHSGLALLSLMFLLFHSIQCIAATNCDGEDTLDGRLCAKFERILEQQEESAIMIGDIDGVPAQQKQALMNQTKRGLSAHGRSKMGDFKQLARDKDKLCETAEYDSLDANDPDDDGNNNGVCEGGENCKEIVGDGIGDDDGICKTRGKPTEREVCVEFCSAEADPEDEDLFNQDLGQEIEESLDHLIAIQEDANESLAYVLQVQTINVESQGALLSNAGVAACNESMKSRPSGVGVALYAKLLAEEINDGFWVGCSQDAAGFNTATACIVTTIIKGAAVTISETLDFIDGNRDSEAIDATWLCAKHLSTEIGNIQSNADAMDLKLDEVNLKLDNVETELQVVENMILRVEELLLTAPGQRPGFGEK